MRPHYREVAQSCETGAATNIIYGLALGYRSAIAPVTLISIVVYVSFHLGTAEEVQKLDPGA